jgi:glutamate-1-semialdehyde aminotransferase
MTAERVPAHLARVGGRLLAGLQELAARHAPLVGVAGVPEMCFLELAGDDPSAALARGCAARGLLFKRSAYNYVSLAHDERTVDAALAVLAEVLSDLARAGRLAGGPGR